MAATVFSMAKTSPPKPNLGMSTCTSILRSFTLPCHHSRKLFQRPQWALRYSGSFSPDASIIYLGLLQILKLAAIHCTCTMFQIFRLLSTATYQEWIGKPSTEPMELLSSNYSLLDRGLQKSLAPAIRLFHVLRTYVQTSTRPLASFISSHS